jgi:hypothetical protein
MLYLSDAGRGVGRADRVHGGRLGGGLAEPARGRAGRALGGRPHRRRFRSRGAEHVSDITV